MASRRETSAVETVLTDPENSGRTGAEVAELVIDALDTVRSTTHRMAVVGQIRHGAEGPLHTVVLGPFSARGILDGPEKFDRAVEGGPAARTTGQALAWDTKSGLGRGRFLLAPAFIKPRDAWDFFRGDTTGEVIAEAIRHVPRPMGPMCSCGLKAPLACHFCSSPMERHCPLHQPEAELHRC